MSATDFSVITHPEMTTDYPDYNHINTLSVLSTSVLNAFKDESGAGQNLLIGASSNVKIEAEKNVQLYTKEGGEFQFYKSTFDGVTRTDTELVSIYDCNNFTALSTIQTKGFVMDNKVTVEGTLYTYTDVIAGNNMYVNGDIVGQTLNMFKTLSNDANSNIVRQVGYAFNINQSNQLELIKYGKWSNVDVHQRVAVFGLRDLLSNDPSDGSSNYDAFDMLSNVSFVTGYSAGGNGGGASGGSGGTVNLTSISSPIIPAYDAMYDLGSNDRRFRDLYLTGQAIYMGDIMIKSDPITGDVSIQDAATQSLKKLMVNEIQVGDVVLSNDGTGNITYKQMLSNEAVELYKIDMSNKYLAKDLGASNAPIYSFNSNDTAGMWAPGSNGELAFSAAGAEAVRIDSSGFVGIGTSSPTERLHVQGLAKVSSNVEVGGELWVSNNANVNGILYALGPGLSVSGSMDVFESATVHTNLTVSGTTTLHGSNEALGGFTIHGIVNTLSNVNVGNDLTVSGDIAVSSNVDVTGSVTIGGNLTVSGTTTTINTQNLAVSDAIVVLNKDQVGVPASFLQSGIEVERGSESNYFFLFSESDDTFRIGMSNSMQPVATREDNPTNLRVPYWDSTNSRFATSGSALTMSNNNFGVGIASPQYPLDVRGTSHIPVHMVGSNNTAIMMGMANAATYANGLTRVGDVFLVGYSNGGTGTDNAGLVLGPRSTTAKGIRIDANGFVGIGTSNPDSLFTVYTATAGTIKLRGNSNAVNYNISNATGGSLDIGLAYNNGDYSTSAIQNDVTIRNTVASGRIHLQNGLTSAALTIGSNNYVGIGTNVPSYPLHVVGSSNSTSIYASHDIVGWSDKRVKGDLRVIGDALDKVQKINGYTFIRTDDADQTARYAGVVAQEVKEVLPEVVREGADGFLSVAYGNMVSLLIEAIKELKSEKDALQQEVEAIKQSLAA